MFKKQNLAIVIPSTGNKKNLDSCLKSIAKQTITPEKIIIIIPKGKIYISRYKNIEVHYSSIKNQVAQRNIGISKLKKNIKILIQLDDKIILDKKAIEFILKCWNRNYKRNIAGIGFNQINKKKSKKVFYSDNSFLSYLFTKIYQKYKIFTPGSVLTNGICIQYENLSKFTKVFWLKGGLCSYDLSKVKKNIYNRKFPVIPWSVCEDLIFSFSLTKKYNLYVCSDAKASIIDIESKNYSFKYDYERGKLYSQNLKYFIKTNIELSFFLFLITTIILFFSGLARGVLTLNLRMICRNFGRLVGFFLPILFNK